MVKKIVFFIFIFFCFSLNLYSSIAGELESMISGTLTNVTEPRLYKTQEGGLAVGGSLRVRVPYKKIQIASITPPRLKAGCGGIDLYFGAFSFINKAELTTLLQMISANAIGYAFEMALEALCPTCNAVIKDLSAKINKILGMLNNSCYMAKAIVNSAVGALTSASQQQCERAGADTLAYPDRVSARLACISSQGPSMQKVWNEFKTDVSGLLGSIGVLEANEDNPNAAANVSYQLPRANIFGNIVMNILNKLNLDFVKKEIFMSAIGTCIFSKPDNSGNPHVNCVPPLFDLKTLVYGNGNGLIDIYSCSNVDGVNYKLCMALARTTESYTPLIEKVRTTLTNIANHIINEDPATGVLPSLTDDEKKFIEICPAPVLRLFEILKKDAAPFIDVIVENSSEYIALYIAKYYLNSIISTLRKFQLTTDLPKAKEYLETLIKTAEKQQNLNFKTAIEKFNSIYQNVILAEAINRQVNNYFHKTKKTDRQK